MPPRRTTLKTVDDLIKAVTKTPRRIEIIHSGLTSTSRFTYTDHADLVGIARELLDSRLKATNEANAAAGVTTTEAMSDIELAERQTGRFTSITKAAAKATEQARFR